jgi:hypothetical protein
MKKGENLKLEEWIVYYDIVYNGTQVEKNEVNFRMLDLEGTGEIRLESFEKFWKSFLIFYSDVMGIKLHYDEKMEAFTKNVFNIMS